eukprot:scaffold118397_cov31-Prasinocladus_malaysianus.AAC.1
MLIISSLVAMSVIDSVITVLLGSWLLYNCYDLRRLAKAGEALQHPLFRCARVAPAGNPYSMTASSEQIVTAIEESTDVLEEDGAAGAGQRVCPSGLP